MRRLHFETLRPVCPRCLAESDAEHRLELSRVEREAGDAVLEGALLCPDPACLSEYPILDGVPILVSPLRSFVREALPALTAREDLAAATESLLGDCAGPGTVYDTIRQHLSTYGTGHYGDLDPEGGPDAAGPESLRATLARGIELLGAEPESPAVDLGCSLGRTAFDLAARTNGPVLGVDLNFSMLRAAQTVLREGRVRYPRKRVGIVYDRREFAVELPGADRVDFWACDATALPFPAGRFRFAAALNLLDVVGSPLALLESLARILGPGGASVLTTPFDWSPTATAVEAWIGGHSQRSEARGASEPLLRSLLAPGRHPRAVAGLSIVAEEESLPWRVRLHDRSAVDYSVYLAAVRAAGD